MSSHVSCGTISLKWGTFILITPDLTGDLKWVSVLDNVSLYVFFSCLVLAPVGINRSMWRESSAVCLAKVWQSFTLRDPSGSKPNFRSCRECNSSQRQVIAAMTTLWALSRSLNKQAVRPGCKTGQASSRWTLPSAFQGWLWPNPKVLGHFLAK